MSKAIPVYMPKFEPTKPSPSTTHSNPRSSKRALQNAQADPLNLKMKPVAEIGDDSSYVCTTNTEEGRKETAVMQTEGNSYIGVAINQSALDCSFETGQNFYHDTEAKGNLKKKLRKSKIKGPLMTLNSPTREERNLSSPQNALINPFTTTSGTLETEARATENNEEMIQSEGQLEEEGKKRFKFSFSVSNRLCFFFYLVFAVGISVGSVFLSTSSINLVDAPYWTNSIIALVTIGFSNFIFLKSIFMKKRPKVFNLMAQNPLNLSIYYFPPSYWIYRGLNVAIVLLSVGIFTNFLLKFTLYERVAIIAAVSANISLISQLLFALYYTNIYKQNLKNLEPKTFLNIKGVKNNKYNEFMDDLKNVKAHIATLRTERDDEDTPPATDKCPPENDKETDLPGNNSHQIEHLPSMSKRHILCGNLIFFSFAAALMIGLMVPLAISRAFNSTKAPQSGITLWGLISGPVIYIGLSGLTGVIFKRLKFQAEFFVDVLLFLGIIGSYKAIFLVYPSRQSNTLGDLMIFTGGKMIWKYAVYLYQMYQLSPSDESKGQTAVYKKKQTETGEVIELFKRSHINFGMKVWFWQYSDIVLSIAYLILLPLISLKSFNQFSHLKHYKAILSPMITLVGEAILEIGGLFLVRYLFIKSNPVVKRVNFVSNLQNYSKQNLAILMLACIFVVFLSINILDITLSFV